MKNKIQLIYAAECYQIIGVCFEVYNKLGYGHKEKFYQEAIAEILRKKKIEFKRELRVKVKFKEKDLGLYCFDFLIFNKIVVEIKKRNYFSVKDINQLYAYLKATGLKLGLLIHFTNTGVKYRRIVNLN
ncbi:MAG: GxxExxY protein [Patescibacteria group bacterium]|nr:GxxExxY protein [Patescibacteria group bacterium]